MARTTIRIEVEMDVPDTMVDGTPLGDGGIQHVRAGGAILNDVPPDVEDGTTVWEIASIRNASGDTFHVALAAWYA